MTQDKTNEIQVDSSQIRLKMVKRFKSKYEGVRIEEAQLPLYLSSNSHPELYKCWIWDLIMHYAIVRFFEIWKKGQVSEVKRGLAGKTKNVESSISGMIGGTLYQKYHAVKKDENGKFYPVVWDNVYSNVPRWPEKGIEAAKELAYSMSAKTKK